MENINNAQQYMSYSGDVKLTTYIGGKPVTKQNFHNAGALSLYRFFANCLVGNFSVAASIRPFKIKLFGLTKPENYLQSNLSGKDIFESKDLVEFSGFIPITTAPEIFYFENGTEIGCKVVLSFVFPYSKITNTGDIHVIGIYGSRSEDLDDVCAYHLLQAHKTEFDENTSTVQNTAGIVWTPITKHAEDEETNKVLAVEWTMTLANKIDKSKEVNN